ncbi:MAG: SusC/RagA family TonB-linked outer membrane protein, partial [Bacteroidota bacterium]
LRANGGEDWQERIFQTGGFASHQIALSGGSEQVDYYISGNYYTQTGAIVDQTYDRYAIRAKLNANPTKKLGLGFNIYGSYEERVGARANVGNAVTFDPATSAFDENGEYNFTSLKNVATGALNPLVTARNNTNERFDDQLIASGYFSYDLAEGLELHVSGGLELLNRSQNNYTPILVNSIGSATVRSGEVSRLQNTNRLTYKKEFGQHGLQIDAIHEQQAITRDSVIATASGFFSDNTTYKNLSLGAIQNTGTAIANEGLQSFAGRVNYSFANRFLLTGTLRVDGSSKFPNDPWGVFPSGSFAWKISEETFMENVRQIDNLKLRVSHGITGSQAIGAFASVPIPLVDNNLNYPFEGEALTVGFAPPNRRASPDLTWEQTAQTNLGLDVGLWTSKVSFSADYYYKKTSDLLLLVTSSEFLGANIINRNVGEVENRGFEVALSLTPIETNDFSINSIISFSKNDNKVLSLVDGTPIELGQEYITNTFPVNPTRVEVGLPISSFRGYIFEGVYQLGEEDEAASFGREVGDAKYRDINGDGNITTDDITAIGDGNADFTWGWNTTISYKGLSLNFLVLGSQGNDVYNFTKGRQLSLGAQTFHAVHVDEKNKWTPENPSNIPKRRTGTHLLSSQFLEDGSFIRLKNLSVSYTFGKNDLLKNVDFIESLRLYTT